MLKIGFDAKRLFNNFTGLGNYSRTLVGNLNRFFPENEYFLYSPKLIKNKRTEPFLRGADYRIRTPNSKFFGSVWRTSGMKKEWDRNGTQIYHGLSHEIPIGSQKSKVKTVVTIHDLIFKKHPELFPFIDRKIYDWKFRYACEKSDRVIAISESTKRDIIRFYKIPESKIEVIYQTCHSIFQEDLPDETKLSGNFKLPPNYLLYVGSVIPRKNLLGCVKALAMLTNDLKLPLIVVGEGKNYKRKVQNYIAEKGLENQVIFLSNVSLFDLKILYQNAQILLYPSFYEGFGLPIIEALFCGTPVITSDKSSLPEAGGGGAFYVNPADPGEIAAGIEKLLTDSRFYNDLKMKGLMHVQKFKANELTQQIMNLYNKLV